MKKILALILSLALVLSLVAMSAFATDEDIAMEGTPSVIAPAADETTADETTADETTADETTADETTADETTADETTGAEDEVVIGDVNEDGVLDILDVVVTRAYIVGNETPDYDFTKADVNGDGEVDIIDVVIMRAAIVNGEPIPAPATEDTDTEEVTDTEAETTGDETSETETTGDETSETETTGDETSETETTGDETSETETTGDETSETETTGEEDSETETTGEEDSETENEYAYYTFFTGEAVATWDSNGVTVHDGSVESYEGDELVIGFTVTGENPALKFIAKVGDNWTWTEIGTALYEDGCIKLTGDKLIIALNENEVAAFNNAKVLLIQGQDVTVTSVALRWKKLVESV